MNMMLSDDDVTRLLGEAAESFPVLDEGPGFVLEELEIVRRPHRAKGRWVKATAAVAAVAAGVLVVQSLGGGGGSGLIERNAATALTRSKLSAGQAAAGGVTGGSTSGTTGGSTSGAGGRALSGLSLAPAAVPQRTYGSTSSTKDAAQIPSNGTGGFEDGAKIVKTGTITLVVSKGKVSSVTTLVTSIANGVDGYIASTKTNEAGDDPTSTLSIRVPVNDFEHVLDQVRATIDGGVGKVQSSSSTGQDVTAQYADTGAQIQSLTAARNRYLLILDKAKTIGEILSVQQRIDSVQGQIDQLTGQLKVLKDQTSLGTLTVTISEKVKAAAKPHVQGGLSSSWDRAKHGFTSGVESLIARSGRALLALIVGLVALGLGWVILRSGWRLARRRMV